MKPTPYLHFDGNCKQALDYYAEHLGGKVAFSMTYGEMPPQPAGAPAAESGCKPDPNFAAKIGHARMVLGEGVIMVSDCPPGRYTKTEFRSVEQRDGHRGGWSSALDRLEEFLATGKVIPEGKA